MAGKRNTSKDDDSPQASTSPRLVSASRPDQSILSSPDRPPFAISFIPASNVASNLDDENTTECDAFSDDAEDFLRSDEHYPTPLPQTALPYFEAERQKTSLIVSGVPSLRPSLVLTTPDTRNDEDEVNAARCKTWVVDQHKRPREGLTLPPVVVRRGKLRNGSARAWFDDETPAHIRKTPQPVTPRWVGTDREEMESLSLGEAVEDVEMDEEKIKVMREAVPGKRGRRSTRVAAQEAELRHFKKKIVEEKEVSIEASPVHKTLTVMALKSKYETADRGTQYETECE